MYRKYLLTLMSDSKYYPKSFEALINEHKILKRHQVKVFKYLQKLESMEILKFLPNKTYKLSENFIFGQYRSKSNFFGFFVPFNKDKNPKDLYIHNKYVSSAMDGDICIARVINTPYSKPGELEGRIILIVEESEVDIVGDFFENENFAFVIPDNKKFKDIYISEDDYGNAKDGDKVVVRVIKRANDGKSPEGIVVEVLGDKNTTGIDIISIIKQYGLNTEFPKEVITETNGISEKIEPNNRLDLRDEMIFTIDGDDSKDFDDAVSIKPLSGGGFELGVHIADVAHYVKSGSPLDNEALKRGTSVYLVDRVLPMLPEKLSNDLCSLKPNIDRYTLSCIMEFDKSGALLNKKIAESIINSKYRMTYSKVNKLLLKEDPSLMEEYEEILPDLELMDRLRNILSARRKDRGSIDFNFPEAKVLLDENKKPVDIVLRDKNLAANLIEEFMIVTNEVISEFFTEKEIPFMYRTHEKPSSEKIETFEKFINAISPQPVKIDVSPKSLSNLLKEYEGKSEYNAISSILLRSMSKAKYSNEHQGHFGLASEYYSHFTSPIRRYPDLQIHRIIKEYLNGKLSHGKIQKYHKELPETARLNSSAEVKAAQCEMESKKLKLCEFMIDKRGQQFEGIVSGVTDRGIYVTLDNTVEGFISAEDLNKESRFFFNEALFTYFSENDPEDKITFGNKVIVELFEVDLNKRQISFIMIY